MDWRAPPAFAALARARRLVVEVADAREAEILEADLVTALGEVLCYHDARGETALDAVARRVARAGVRARTGWRRPGRRAPRIEAAEAVAGRFSALGFAVEAADRFGPLPLLEGRAGLVARRAA